jgi:pyruvate-ferredoxin/flavodoxin oxidoreductase
VCPHATIRPFLFSDNEKTPENFASIPAQGMLNARFRIQVSPFDCKGCGVCAQTCPTKEKALVMRPANKDQNRERTLWDFALSLPKLPLPSSPMYQKASVKGSQFSSPLFEFSYACAGCGETPYLKLLTQLFGEKMLIANATGCSSIYGGSFPTCPYAKNEQGKGPAWANSLFEDNAEFGLGMRLAWDIRGDENKNEKSVWLIGGDGWAYDIGYGGLDHVLASKENVNILVLDSQVYSNTGGQVSKATPMGATARFSVNEKKTQRKDLALMAITYGTAYVAQVSMGADKQQLLKAFLEAENYQGPSLIIAYSPCIAHGVNLNRCMDEEKRAVESGFWQLFRFDPRKKEEKINPFSLDCKPPTLPLQEFFLGENRFLPLTQKTKESENFFKKAEENCLQKRKFLEKLTEFYTP